MAAVIVILAATFAIDVDLEERASNRIVERTNTYRAQRELTPLKTNRELQKAAKYFARYLADQELEEDDDGLDHEADGKTPAERAEEHGYEYCIVLENIAMHPQRRGQTADDLAKALAEGWQGSEHHRENLLDPDVTDTAVAIGRNEETERYFAVQLFGRPESARIEFSITNKTEAEVKYVIEDREFTLKPGVTRTHSYCLPPKLAVELGKERLTKLRPKSGDTLAVMSTDGELVVERATK